MPGMRPPSSKSLCEALLTIVMGLLLANILVLTTSLPTWVVLVTKESFWFFAVGILVSAIMLAIMYQGTYLRTRRARFLGSFSTLVLAIITLPFGLIAKDETKILMERCDDFGEACTIVSMLLSYGTLALSFGVAAVSASLLANLFPQVETDT
ncbi:hypothetical protein [Arenimonas sp.]|uniref:hypothetical protein n=1 Tax=Arenimonas sp. TaxID=1872635 RepID=UPI0035B30624